MNTRHVSVFGGGRRPNIRPVPRDNAPFTIDHADLMQTTLHARPFTAAGWLFKMKLDGFRALACRRGAEVELLSRRGRPMGAQFPEIIAQLKRISGAQVRGRSTPSLWFPMSAVTRRSKACGDGPSCADRMQSERQQGQRPRRFACSMCYRSTDKICDRFRRPSAKHDYAS